MAFIPQILANTNLFVDGKSFQGDVPSQIGRAHV